MQIVVIQTIFLSPFFLKTTTCARINILGRSWKYNSLPRQEVDCRGMLLVYVVVVVVKHICAFTPYTLNCLIYTLGARNELFCAQLLLKQVVEVVVKNPLAFTPYTLHFTLF